MALKKLFTNRKWLLLVMMSVVMILLLSGCTSTNGMATMKTADLLEGNFWQRNVVYYFSLALDTFAGWFNGAYGLAILMITIIVRSAILPLTIKQVRSSREMQKIQPLLNDLKKKYKDNPQTAGRDNEDIPRA